MKKSSSTPRTFPRRNPSAAPSFSTPTLPEHSLLTAVVSRRASDRLRAGHPWVYASDVEHLPEALAPGSLVHVTDVRGALLGSALYSSASQIALRLLTRDTLPNRAALLDLLRTRIRAALALRTSLLASANGTNACRLIFGEAEQLPGIVADRYGDLVILQLLTQGTDAADIRALLVEELRSAPAPISDPASILERPDPRIRELEQLAAPATTPLYTRDSAAPLTATLFQLNSLRFHYDANAGQKTGAFLDQRENYAAAAAYAHGRALDVCTYQGGFALHLARRCPQVTGVDVSRAALEVAEKNLVLNRSQLASHGEGVDWIEANAFDLLRDWSDAGEVFDTIVLDPPAFAKSKRAADSAWRGYKELNLRALKMLRSGGTLITCSCSHHVPLADFQAAIASAASDAGQRVRLLETRGAALDHPAILTIPETQYLKCLILRVE